MTRREAMGGALAVTAMVLLPGDAQPTAIFSPARLFVDTKNNRCWIQEKSGVEYRLFATERNANDGTP